MSQSAAEHRSQSPERVGCAVVTVSDTRTLETDTGGGTIVERLTAAGHEVMAREIVPDEPRQLRSLLVALSNRPEVDAILITGGTGISRRDRTFETVTDLLDKQIPGYGELFRWLSFAEIGAAAMLSRTIGGLLGQTVVLTMPGSPHAVCLAMEKLVLPELGHLVREARR
ncbi:MAG: MogA/MoaB family molybdenum cofactor biosynthesis protein [Pirellulales bacterium]|nr:MogA/MoaB family molybdenum cofactor biosynthesis protein [Pirellulales bacterium]